jgi:hypothetical protein
LSSGGILTGLSIHDESDNPNHHETKTKATIANSLFIISFIEDYQENSPNAGRDPNDEKEITEILG